MLVTTLDEDEADETRSAAAVGSNAAAATSTTSRPTARPQSFYPSRVCIALPAQSPAFSSSPTATAIFESPPPPPQSSTVPPPTTKATAVASTAPPSSAIKHAAELIDETTADDRLYYELEAAMRHRPILPYNSNFFCCFERVHISVRRRACCGWLAGCIRENCTNAELFRLQQKRLRSSIHSFICCFASPPMRPATRSHFLRPARSLLQPPLARAWAFFAGRNCAYGRFSCSNLCSYST